MCVCVLIKKKSIVKIINIFLYTVKHLYNTFQGTAKKNALLEGKSVNHFWSTAHVVVLLIFYN